MASTTAIAVVSTAVLLTLAAAAAAAADDVDVDVDSSTGVDSSPCPSALYLYQPLCSRACIKQTYTTCECMDAPCSEGPYRYKFIKNESDPARAYLFTEPGCKGDVTVVRRTVGGCRNFKFHSVKVCPPCTRTATAAEEGAAEE